MERIEHTLRHLSPVPTSHSLLPKCDRDVVIVRAVRTPICKAKRGGFSECRREHLLVPVLQEVLQGTGVEPREVGDIVVGTVLPRSGQGATECRVAALLAGYPAEVPVQTCNRQCSSGLQSIAIVASSIQAGFYKIGVAAGVECMSRDSNQWRVEAEKSGDISEEALRHPVAQGCYVSMGITSENVAQRFNISREEQDELAVLSHARANQAWESGRFLEEVIPVRTPNGNIISKDDGIRASTTLEALAKLKPAFTPTGSTTAGNASQVSDGAAASLLMSRGEAERRGLQILGVLRSFAVVGCDPNIMGIGPALAIPAALKQAGLTIEDVDLFEINEAFASQATYCINKLGIDIGMVNVNGGAIALGHPLGCTGVRMTSTLLHEMRRRSLNYGVVSMCIGTGMGAAAIFSAE